MNKHELSALLFRAAAALESPNGLTEYDVKFLIEDLVVASTEIRREYLKEDVDA